MYQTIVILCLHAFFSQSKIKEKLATLFSHLMPYMENWAFQSGCSCTFLSLITSDIKRQEQNARAKV